MKVRQFIRPEIAGSVLAHLMLLGMVVLFSEVHPFGTVTAESIAVDLVTPDEIANKPAETAETKPADKLQLQLPKEDVDAPAQQSASQPAPSPSAALPAPQQQQQHAERTDRREAAAEPQATEQQAAQPALAGPPLATPSPAMPPPTTPPVPAPQHQAGYTPPEPDLTVKYGVMLGLPEPLPPASSAGDKPGDGIDANASSAANISSSLVAKFREHLRSCAKLPASIARSDNIFVKLRVVMTPQARLAAEPILVEGTASAKALDLKESAVKALAACQPYDMLPADRYGEWKVLDLSFTPQDFG